MSALCMENVVLFAHKKLLAAVPNELQFVIAYQNKTEHA